MRDLSHDRTLRDRLHAGLESEPGGCALWTGACNEQGYGRIGVRGADGRFRATYVHVVAWELENGPVPDNLELDHVKDRGCRYRNCASLAHLEPVTHAVNMLRSARTHCRKNHHEYTPENTRINKAGGRVCRACQRDAQQRWRDDHPGYFRVYDQRRTRVRIPASG